MDGRESGESEGSHESEVTGAFPKVDGHLINNNSDCDWHPRLVALTGWQTESRESTR